MPLSLADGGVIPLGRLVHRADSPAPGVCVGVVGRDPRTAASRVRRRESWGSVRAEVGFGGRKATPTFAVRETTSRINRPKVLATGDLRTATVKRRVKFLGLGHPVVGLLPPHPTRNLGL